MEIVGQYSSIENSYLRVISSIYNENVQLKEKNAELQKRIQELEEEGSDTKRTKQDITENFKEIEDLKLKNAKLGQEIHAKNTKLQNQAKQLKEFKDIFEKRTK